MARRLPSIRNLYMAIVRTPGARHRDVADGWACGSGASHNTGVEGRCRSV